MASAPDARHTSSFAGDEAAASTARAQHDGELDGREADAAGRTQHRHPLAGLHVGDAAERVVRGAYTTPKAEASMVVTASGTRVSARSGAHTICANAPTIAASEHAVAGREMGDVAPDGDDAARVLAPRHERRGNRHLVAVGEDEDVGVVEGRGFDADDDIARARLGIGHLLHHHRLRWPVLQTPRRSHGRRLTPSRFGVSRAPKRWHL